MDMMFLAQTDAGKEDLSLDDGRSRSRSRMVQCSGRCVVKCSEHKMDVLRQTCCDPSQSIRSFGPKWWLGVHLAARKCKEDESLDD